MRYSEILSEEIHGSGLAVVYHRTKSTENVEAIENHGFVPGDGDAYGRGIYATYDFASQQRPEMLKYGPYVLKNRVNLKGFIIFDMDVARMVYGEHHSMADQCELFGISGGERWDHQIEQNKTLQRSPFSARKPGFTSNVAYFFIDNVHFSRDKIKGLVFTGERDGRVVVAYDANTITPYAFAESGADDLVKTEPSQFNWRPLDVRKAAAKRMGVHRPTVADRAKTMFQYPLERESVPVLKWFLRNWRRLPHDDVVEIFGNLVAQAYRWVLNTNIQVLLTDEDRALLEDIMEQPDFRYGMDKLAHATEKPDTSMFGKQDDLGWDDWDD